MIRRIINAGQSFLITSHVRLDGDALGSELALYHALRSMGKKVVVYNQDKTPDMFTFLPGSEAIVNTFDVSRSFDAVFVVDCSDLERVGEEAQRVSLIFKIINIDHHISNDHFGDAAFVDAAASSTGELLYGILQELGVPFSEEVAVNLYTAIMTDTGSFRYSNTGSETFRVAAELMEFGADPAFIAEHVYERNPVVQFRLLGSVLQTMELQQNGMVGFMHVTLGMLAESGALPEHTEEFVNFIRSVNGVRVAFLLQEIEPDYFKVSLRSKKGTNIEPVARTFGGGGHANAAGCRIRGDLETVKRLLLQALDMLA